VPIIQLTSLCGHFRFFIYLFETIGQFIPMQKNKFLEKWIHFSVHSAQLYILLVGKNEKKMFTFLVWNASMAMVREPSKPPAGLGFRACVHLHCVWIALDKREMKD
jgi:hypothetical protein